MKSGKNPIFRVSRQPYLHIMGDTALTRASSTFGIQISKAFEVTVLMLWFFKPFQISVVFAKCMTVYAPCSSVNLHQNLPILAFPKSIWMCERTQSIPRSLHSEIIASWRWKQNGILQTEGQTSKCSAAKISESYGSWMVQFCIRSWTTYIFT